MLAWEKTEEDVNMLCVYWLEGAVEGKEGREQWKRAYKVELFEGVGGGEGGEVVGAAMGGEDGARCWSWRVCGMAGWKGMGEGRRERRTRCADGGE